MPGKHVLILFVLLLGFGSITRASGDPFDTSQQDKQLHMAASYGLAFSGTEILEKHEVPRWKSVLYASLATLAIGAIKEFAIDKQSSEGDLIADTVGTAASAGIVFAFDL